MKGSEESLTEKNFKTIEESTHLYSSTEIALKNLSNWVLGINLGLFTIIILKIQDILEIKENPIFYKILIILSLISLSYSGLIKHRFLLRDKMIHILNDSMRIELKYGKIDRAKIGEAIDEKYKYLSEIQKLDKMINYSIILSFVTLVIFALYILVQL